MIQDESIKIVYNGDGVNTVFDYPYALDSESSIICYIYDNQGDELITAGQQFKDGTTTSAERNEKKITVKVGNKAPTNRYDITLTRTTPTDQLTDLPNVYPYNDIEKSLDKTTLQMQELKDAQSRALKVSEDVNVDVVLPKPKPNSVYAWNDAADKLVSLGLDTTTTAEEFNRLGDDIKNLLAETTQFHDTANKQYQELLAKYSQLQATFDAMYVRQDGTKYMTDSLAIKNPNRYSGINLYDTDGSHVDIENCIDGNNIANIIQRNSSNQTVAKVTIPKKTGELITSVDFNPLKELVGPLKELVGLGGIVAQRLETNGFIKFANGFTIQWGTNNNDTNNGEWTAYQPLAINYTTPLIAVSTIIEQAGRKSTSNFDNNYRLYNDHIVFRYFYHSFIALGIS